MSGYNEQRMAASPAHQRHVVDVAIKDTKKLREENDKIRGANEAAKKMISELIAEKTKLRAFMKWLETGKEGLCVVCEYDILEGKPHHEFGCELDRAMNE